MSFALRALEALCPPDHVYKAALYPERVELDAYTSDGEWVGHGYVSGGAQLSGRRISLDGSEAVLQFNNVEWIDVDVKVRTILVYDATTGNAINVTHLERVAGVIGGLFEYKMPDKGVARIG